MSLVLGASLLPDAATRELGLALIGLAAAAAIGFRIVERRARAPLFPPGTLRNANLRTGTIAAFLNTATTSSAIAIATLELQRQQHLNPGAAAVRLIPMSLGAVSGALLAGRLQASRPHRVVLGWGLRTIALRRRNAGSDAGRILAAGDRSRARRSRDRPGIGVRHTNRHRRTASPARHRGWNAEHRRTARRGRRNSGAVMPRGVDHRQLTTAVRRAARLARGRNTRAHRSGSPRRPPPSLSAQASVPSLMNTEPAPQSHKSASVALPRPGILARAFTKAEPRPAADEDRPSFSFRPTNTKSGSGAARGRVGENAGAVDRMRPQDALRFFSGTVGLSASARPSAFMLRCTPRGASPGIRPSKGGRP